MIALSRGAADQLHYLNHQIQMLQQVQQLLTTEATLADVAGLLAHIETDYGVESSLEDVIQHLVSQHLALQIEQRKAFRRYTESQEQGR